MMEEPPKRRAFDRNEVALASMSNALRAWKKAAVPADALEKPLKDLGFHDGLAEYLHQRCKIKTGYALRQADPDQLVEHFREHLKTGKISGGTLVVFSGNLRNYLKKLGD